MELSLLCEVKVCLCIVDKNERVMIFSSETDVEKFVHSYMHKPAEAREMFGHEDVLDMC